MYNLNFIKITIILVITCIIVSITFSRCTGDISPAPDLKFKYKIDSLNLEIEKRDSLISLMYTHLPFGSPTDTINISSGFGYRIHPITRRRQIHLGIDLKADRRDTVYAAANGIIGRSGWYGGHGRYVEIEHDFNYKTSYSHLHKIFVKKNDTVIKSEPIGLIGNTGFSTGPHLHYEIIKCDENVDPIDYLFVNPDTY